MYVDNRLSDSQIQRIRLGNSRYLKNMFIRIIWLVWALPVTYFEVESVFFSRIDSSDSVDDARLRVDDELASSVAGRCVNQRVLNPPIVGPVVVHGLDLPCWKFL